MAKSQFSDKLLKSEYNKSGYHVYRYDFEYYGQLYHYVGSTKNTQIQRIYSGYNELINVAIKLYGIEQFLFNYCTIIKWFNSKIEATDFEEQLNKQLKEEFGEDCVLSINNGRKPSQKCLQKAVEHQKEYGSWNKGKKLSKEHRESISKGLSNFNVQRGKRQILECIDLYLNDKFDYKFRIQRYIRLHYDKTFILTKNTIVPYIDIIKDDLE